MPKKKKSEVWFEAQRSEEFLAHKRRYRRFAFPMAIFFLVWYFSFILLATFARDFMSIFVFGYINIALVLALMQFVTTFLIAWLYDRYSTKHLDGPGEKLKNRIESELQA